MITPEQSVANMVGDSFTGAAIFAAGDTESPVSDPHLKKFEFEGDFQLAIATHAALDSEFIRKVGHLLRPEYFDNVGHAAVVNIALRFFREYGTLPNKVSAAQMLKDDLANKVLRGDHKPEAFAAFKAIYGSTADLSNGDYFAQQVATFARQQAYANAIMESVDLLEKGRFDSIEEKMRAAGSIGVNADGEEYDYWGKIGQRTQIRQDKLAGLILPTGITTGYAELDNLLYHRGWGRKELSVLMGGAKSGKTTGLINFAKNASLDGKNVLYVTLEVAKEIIGERLDACISDTLIKELGTHIHDVKAKVDALAARAGKIQIHEYPSGTFTPAMLEALIERYKSPGINPDGTIRPAIKFDMVVVDYADIMQPDRMHDDPKENSKQVYLRLREIAHREDVAMLTATQTNREGMKATVADMTTVADDINKVRTVDVLISINKNEDERAAGEARLFFAASRNQESGITVVIQQDMGRMKFITKILRRE